MIENWKEGIDYPEWMKEEGLKTLRRQHLLDNETPKQMYERISSTLGKVLAETKKIDVEVIQEKWFNYMWKGWLCPATPILANTGTTRGFTISCFIERLEDSLDSIYSKVHELAMLTKSSGGVGVTFDKVRGRGEPISVGGFSEGVIPFMKVYDSAIIAASQGNVRRGSASINLPIRHKDAKEFLKIRQPKGDVNRQSLNLNHCFTIDDYFMESLKTNSENLELWAEVLSTRMKTGQPYIMYYHNANRFKPQDMIKRNLKIDGTNICCLAGDTEVITKEGIFKIQDLVGKTVTVWDGKNWVLCNNFQEYSEDEIYRIHLKNGSYLDSNKNHRWFAAKNYNAIRKNRYKEITTENLEIGMFLETSFQEYHGEEKLKGAYVKGFLLGDGTSSRESPILNIHFPKYNCIEKIISSAKELEITNFNANCITEVEVSEEVINPSTWGEQRFKKLKGIVARNKDLLNFSSIYKHDLPDFKNLCKKDKLELLSGLFDADGTYSTSGIQLSSIHFEFIQQLQKLIFSLGISCGVDTIIRENKNIIYRLTIGNYDSYELFKELNCFRLTQPDIKPNRKTTGFRQIIKIEKLNSIQKVYCPQILTTKKFLLANGVMTGNTEIMSFHDKDHTVVCDLASMNLIYIEDMMKDPEFIELALLFLDTNMSLFIKSAKGKSGFDNAVRFAEKSRLLGLGILGWHTYLQKKKLPFISLQSRAISNKIGNWMQEQGELYNKKYGKLLGNPEWCDENRNLALFAFAPTTTNALVSGGVSQGLEPLIANAWVQQSAKGTFIRKNSNFERLISKKYPEHNTGEFWNKLSVEYKGSCQWCEFLTLEEKEVFLTAYEINQLELVKQAAIWQKYVDQGISLNLFFPADVEAKWFNKVHYTAWEEGLKSLYYVRTESILSRNMKGDTFSDCLFCEG